MTICEIGFTIAWESLSVPQHLLPSKDKYLHCMANYSLLSYITITLLVPTYHFLIYPFFYKYIPIVCSREMELVLAYNIVLCPRCASWSCGEKF